MVVTTTTRSRRHPRRQRGRGRDSADGQVLGVLLVLGGVGWFLQQVGVLELSLTTTLSLLLITLGVGLVMTARRAGGAGLVIVGLVLVVVLASASTVDVGLLQKGIGERTFTPVAADDVLDEYQLGIGTMKLDLTEANPGDLLGRSIDVQIGMGELIVLLPPADEVAVVVRAKARAGEVDLFGTRVNDDGTNVTGRFHDPRVEGAAPLELDLDVGLGTVQVLRPSP